MTITAEKKELTYILKRCDIVNKRFGAKQTMISSEYGWAIHTGDEITILEEVDNPSSHMAGYQVRNERTKETFFLSYMDIETLKSYKLY
ncbi:hypothetical protein MOB65_20430 [Bacillus inaquosorum]|uniref:hypothetical protein n=1 Tax=Bacillus inaquosorum TaxID=483913 RepID=UPI0022819844|nr:hypothetical protein [Bacillus inaquosorum]MCY7911226.1 hypothetical protein [Bacillus inaquosorum]